MTGSGLLGITGKIRIELTGACPEDCLTYLTRQGIRFRDYEKKDPLTATVTLGLRDLGQAQAAAKKTMCELKIISVSGIVPGLRAMGLRCLYPLVLALLVLLVFWLQTHILFFEVEGNTTIPAERILAVLEDNGIGFWTSTRNLKINLLKNQVLADIPELEFITINTQGPFATVLVRQRHEKPETKKNSAPANLIAAKGGIIEAVTVTGGSAQVKAGDVVTRGQLLISGVTNLDKILLLSRGEGEVTARTFIRKTAVLGNTQNQKQYTGRERTCFSITFGKNTINFYKTSGISYDNYDRMTVRKPLTLPGGYTLPVSVNVISLREYTLCQVPLDETSAEVLLSEAVCRDTQESLLAGMILETRTRLRQDANAFYLSGILECREDIGQLVEIQD